MRRSTIVLLTAYLLVSVYAAPAAADELRGLWVDAFHPGFKSPEQTKQMVAMAKECNFNTLFVQVRKRSDVYYSSRIEPIADDVASGYDPLADIIEKAHAAGLQVHAWVVTYEVYHENKWAATYPRMVHRQHPEWLCKDRKGGARFYLSRVYLDPGHPEVRDYIAGIVDEIVTDYQVDGIHLDVLRYPGKESGYNETSVALFNKEKNRSGKPDPSDEEWCRWRKEQIATLVKDVHQNLSKSKRRVVLSASVTDSPWVGVDDQFQDWASWVKSGIIDFVVPLVFPNDSRLFADSAKRIATAVGTSKVCLGQAGFKMDAANSAEQIGIARSSGFKGIVVYNYDTCRRPTEVSATPLLSLLKTGLFAQPDKSTF